VSPNQFSPCAPPDVKTSGCRKAKPTKGAEGMTLEMDASHLSVDVVNRYLQIKRRAVI
jgi:hypothetical protein